MRILVDVQLIPGAYLPGSHVYLIGIMMEIARRHPDVSFVFLSNGSSKNTGNFPGNVTFQYINNNLYKWMGKRTWYKYLLPQAITRSKANLYISIDNVYLRKRTIPSCLFLIECNALLEEHAHLENNNKKSAQLNSAIQNADAVLTFSKNNRHNIQQQVPAAANKIKMLKPPASDISELNWTEKEMIKVEFATGVEYFAFAGDINERYDLVSLLKAFTLFKKWQQSNMKLLLVGNRSTATGEFSKKLDTYKYRHDVHLLIDQSEEEVKRIVSAAYAFVYPALQDHFPVNVLLAMQAGVPVISAPIQVCEEWAGNSIMYPDTNDTAGFAKSMQRIYKDEKLRSNFIEAGKKQGAMYQKNDLAAACMNIFRKVLQSKSW